MGHNFHHITKYIIMKCDYEKNMSIECKFHQYLKAKS